MTSRRILALTLLIGLVAASGSALAHRRAARPDLEGTWSSNYAGFMERNPDDFKTVRLSEAEARAWEARFPDFAAYQAELARRNPKANFDLNTDPGFEETRMGLPRIDGVARSSVIFDPPDGKLPWSKAGKDRLAAVRASHRGWSDPEQATSIDRCMTGYLQGPPLSPGGAKGNIQIVQTRDTVALRAEEADELRVIRLTGAHAPRTLQSWGGDSIGWYEGDTLVVETTSFNPQQTLRLNTSVYLLSPEAVVIERFRRISAHELRYSYEVSDPANYTRPWRGEAPFQWLGTPLIEDACHEGNYDLPNILAGARHDEAVAVAAIRAFAEALEPPR